MLFGRACLVNVNKTENYIGHGGLRRIKNSVAILAEISENARNLKLIADGNFRTIGREILPKNARNFTLTKFSPKPPKIWPKLAKKGANFDFFLIGNFQFFFI